MRHSNTSFAVIIVVIFMLAIFIPFVGAFLQQDQGISYTEKRKLQQLPEFPERLEELSSFIPQFEKYYNDQFGLRDIFIKSYKQAKKLVGDHDISGTSGNVGTKNTVKGKEGWFFLNRKWDGDPFSDYRNIDLYSENELLRSTLLFAARADWLKSQGIEYLFFFAPNKHTVYSEYLPDYIKKEGDISSLDQLDDALRRYTNVHFVDLRNTLQQAKDEASKYWKDQKEEAALYYKKDSHWNGAGADIAQFEIARKIEELFPGKIHPAKRPFDDFVMSAFAGDITLIMGGKEKEAYGPVLEKGLCTSEKKSDYLQRQHVTVCEKGILNAVIFYDSFFPPLKPYFTDYFHRTVYYWEEMSKSKVEEQISIKKPDIIIEERAERHLPFTPDTENESYSEFWEKHWPKWKNTVFELDLKEAGKAGRSDNVTLSYNEKDMALLLEAVNDDPILYLPKTAFVKNRLYLVKTIIVSDHDTELELFYSVIGKENQFSQEHSVTTRLGKGENTVFLPLFSMDLAGDLRFDPGKKSGKYRIQGLEIKEIDWIDLR